MSANGRHPDPHDPGDELIDLYLVELLGDGTAAPPDLTDRILDAVGETPAAAADRDHPEALATEDRSMPRSAAPTDPHSRPLAWTISLTVAAMLVMALIALALLQPDPTGSGTDDGDGDGVAADNQRDNDGDSDDGDSDGDNDGDNNDSDADDLPPVVINENARVLRVVPADWQRFLARAEAFELLSLDPKQRPAGMSARLADHTVEGTVAITDESLRGRLLASLYDSVADGQLEQRRRNVRWPIHAIRARSGDETLEVIISYRTGLSARAGDTVRSSDLSRRCEGLLFRLLLGHGIPAWTDQGRIEPTASEDDDALVGFHFNSNANSGDAGPHPERAARDTWQVRVEKTGALEMSLRRHDMMRHFGSMPLDDRRMLRRLVVAARAYLASLPPGDGSGSAEVEREYRFGFRDSAGGEHTYLVTPDRLQSQVILRSLAELLAEYIQQHTGNPTDFPE